MKNGIARLEEDLDSNKQGNTTRTFFDDHPALNISFDPPSLRPLSFAYYSHLSNNYSDLDQEFREKIHAELGIDEEVTDRPFDEDFSDLTSLLPKVKKRGYQLPTKKSLFAHKIFQDTSLSLLREDTLILPVQERAFQEKT
ncbi:unnamed protein product, partial [Amoebophrya sp. A120]